jgi:hypothetical protein
VCDIELRLGRTKSQRNWLCQLTRDWSILSSERTPNSYKHNYTFPWLKCGHEPPIGFDTKTNWLTVSCEMDMTLALNVNWGFGWRYRLHLQGRKISQAIAQRESKYFCLPPALMLVYFLKMEAICSSETSSDSQQTTQRRNHRCENPKSDMKLCFFRRRRSMFKINL